jgi:integrase
MANGKWRADVSLGYDANGKRKRKPVYGRTQKEVRQKLDDLKQQLAQGTLSTDKLTVKEYLERWLSEKARQVKPRTAELYREQAERYVIPHIGRTRLSKLTPMQVQEMMGALADKVGIPTANKARKLLYGALKQAVRWQLVPRNVCEAVDPFKENAVEMKLWTPAEAVQFLDTARVHRLHAAFYLLMATGLRRGEVLGLQWQDLKGDRLHIRRSYTIIGGKPAWSTPKTQKGVRFVVVPADALAVLELHRQQQAEERAFLGAAWLDGDFIFTLPDGCPVAPGTFHKMWLRLQKEASVPQVRLHDLRHLHVSLLVKQGFDPRAIADRVGHTDPAFTMRRYAHMFEEQRQAAAMNLTDLLRPKAPSLGAN